MIRWLGRGTALAMGILPLVFAPNSSMLAQRSQPQPAEVQREHTVEVAPLPIGALVAAAERVFIGKVRSIAPLTEQRPEFQGLPRKDLREVTLDVYHVLKGTTKISPGNPLRVKQYVPRAPEIVQNQQVLWFLPQDSEIGFAAPIGIASGSFEISLNPRFPGHYLAVNGHQNRGLWDEDHKLWDLYSEYDARDLLVAFGIHEALIQEVLLAGKQKGSFGPIPVELLRVVLFLRPTIR